MSNQPRYLVVYKDSAAARALYFGPFVSESIAKFFEAEMPKPLEGGVCHIRPLQPFTQNDGHIVNEKIMRDRHVNAQ